MMEVSHQQGTWSRIRKIDPGIALLVFYSLFMICLVLFGSLLESEAAENMKNEKISPEAVQRGELLIASAPGIFTPAPMLRQKVKIDISGIVSRVKVEQTFINRENNWIEALYVFPLPEESAVDHLNLKIGERVIKGEIMEKAQAEATYVQAKKEGRKSSLLLQRRPNIFTTKVANIGPGETVTVEIEYQQTVTFNSGVFSIRFPMVVAPRYIPGNTFRHTEDVTGEGSVPLVADESGWAANTDQVPDASAITPPVDMQEKNPIATAISVNLAAGFSLSRVDSLYHGMSSQLNKNGQYSLQLTGEIKADRDFVLEWEPKEKRAAQVALFGENTQDGAAEHHMLLMLLGPGDVERAPVPRELIFILDISGSMAGTSIAQAKAAISTALSRLRSHDSFNIIVFNNSASSLYPSVQRAMPEKVSEALRFVDHLQANGGTEMREALLLALDGKDNHERLRQVVFLTDGAVGNETALFELISERLGDSRLFTVGIGSAPNSYFMTRVATLGRGTYTFVGKLSEVLTKITTLFEKIESPVLSDLRIKGEGENISLEYYPSPIPDLYTGEPLVVAIKSSVPGGTIHVFGNYLGKPWQRTVSTSTYGERSGVSVLWARKKIRSLMDSLSFGTDEAHIRSKVTETALKHHLVSKYTSLVAVDKEVSRPGNEKSIPGHVKTHLPNGWKINSVFGGGAQTGTDSQLKILLGILFLSIGWFMLWRRHV